MPRPRSLPARTCGDSVEVELITALVLPATTSIAAGPAPRNGTCSISSPACIRNSSMPRCSEPPTPADAYWMSPGFDLASAMNSLSVLAGSDGMHRERVRARQQHRDRLERLAQIVGQIVERGMHGVGDRDHRDGVAVGRRARRVFGADHAAGAGLEFHQELLAQPLAQLVGNDARPGLVDAARIERNDDPHRPRRIIVGCGRGGREGGDNACSSQQRTRGAHGPLLRLPASEHAGLRG